MERRFFHKTPNELVALIKQGAFLRHQLLYIRILENSFLIDPFLLALNPLFNNLAEQQELLLKSFAFCFERFDILTGEDSAHLRQSLVKQIG